MSSRTEFSRDFTSCYPRNRFPHVTIEEYRGFIDTYIDQRIEWELEYGWLYKAGFIIGCLFIPVFLIGGVILAALDKSKHSQIAPILDRLGERLLVLEAHRVEKEDNEPF